MSTILGLEQLAESLGSFDAALVQAYGDLAETALRQCQKDAAQFAPVRTGKLKSLLSSGEALLIKRHEDGLHGEFGFRTAAMRKEGFRYFFVEFGTKAVAKGGYRTAGVDKKGRYRKQRAKRNIPARPAQPFMRPAFRRLQQRLVDGRNQAVLNAALKFGLNVRIG